MKHFFIFAAFTLGAMTLQTSCSEPVPQPSPVQKHLVESTTIVGLWQQMKTNEVVDEETGADIVQQIPRARYKCIMADGTYFLLDAEPREDGSEHSAIIHYGRYSIVGDSLEIEHIEVCPTVPSLNGHDSHVRYSLPDNNTMTLYYKFALEEGIPGSTEWTPEFWKRVTMMP